MYTDTQSQFQYRENSLFVRLISSTNLTREEGTQDIIIMLSIIVSGSVFYVSLGGGLGFK